MDTLLLEPGSTIRLYSFSLGFTKPKLVDLGFLQIQPVLKHIQESTQSRYKPWFFFTHAITKVWNR